MRLLLGLNAGKKHTGEPQGQWHIVSAYFQAGWLPKLLAQSMVHFTLLKV